MDLKWNKANYGLFNLCMLYMTYQLIFQLCRNKVPGSPHSSEYNFPPGRTIGVPIENGFRDSEVHVSG